jgi:hypothetical protein
MTNKTKNILRLISVILVLIVVLENMNVTNFDLFSNNGEFWVLVGSYAMLLVTLRK